MGFIQICVFLVAIAVARSAVKQRVCKSSTLDKSYFQLDNLWEINGVECESDITMVVINIKRINFIALNFNSCIVNATVAGINLCFAKPGTCIIVMPQDLLFESQTPSDCEFTIFTAKKRVLPLKLSYRSYGTGDSFELGYRLYVNMEKEQDTTTPVPTVSQTETSQHLVSSTSCQTSKAPEIPCSCCHTLASTSISDDSSDTTASVTTVPQREAPQATQKNQSVTQSLAIVFGILFGIASAAFAFLLYRFMQQRKELSQFYTSATIPRSGATTSASNVSNADAVYSHVLKKRGPNNTSEAEVTVNELYHM